jgi:hypothetical protein
MLRSNITQSATLAYMGVHYVAIAAGLKYLSSRDLLRVRDVFLLTAAAGGALSLYQVAHVAFGWPYVDWLRTSTLYYKSNTLNWHGGEAGSGCHVRSDPRLSPRSGRDTWAWRSDLRLRGSPIAGASGILSRCS